MERINIFSDHYQALKGSNAIAVLTEWDEFKDIDFKEAHSMMKQPAWVFDGRNLLNHAELKRIGFEVKAIGKVL